MPKVNFNPVLHAPQHGVPGGPRASQRPLSPSIFGGPHGGPKGHGSPHGGPGGPHGPSIFSGPHGGGPHASGEKARNAQHNFNFFSRLFHF
ncbi:MAG: hypothetical protein WC197_09325 [Candidatus Gastranaerophilaceae bacterium]